MLQREIDSMVVYIWENDLEATKGPQIKGQQWTSPAHSSASFMAA